MVNQVNWTGASGAVYAFELNPLGIAYNRRSGVYIFCRQAANGNWDGLYVGETSDFDDRLNSGLQRHHRWPSVMQHRPTHLCTLHVPGALAERLRIETDLRRSLNCPCNRQ
jgi:hypothetical protein